VVSIVVTDLQARYEGDLSTFNQDYLQTQIDDAVAYVDSTYPVVKYRLGNGRLSVQSYKRVIANMVIRVIRNPTGLASEGDGTYSYSYWHGAATGGLNVLPDEGVILTGKTGGGMRTIGMALDAGWQ
jgi:hypothetical protein